MATTTGKAARKKLGNRFACKRNKSHKTNPEKQIRWQQIEEQRLRKKHEKLQIRLGL